MKFLLFLPHIAWVSLPNSEYSLQKPFCYFFFLVRVAQFIFSSLALLNRKLDIYFYFFFNYHWTPRFIYGSQLLEFMFIKTNKKKTQMWDLYSCFVVKSLNFGNNRDTLESENNTMEKKHFSFLLYFCFAYSFIFNLRTRNPFLTFDIAELKLYASKCYYSFHTPTISKHTAAIFIFKRKQTVKCAVCTTWANGKNENEWMKFEWEWNGVEYWNEMVFEI